jgi:hypothetical protein
LLNIGGIVDYHYLNFLLIIEFDPQSSQTNEVDLCCFSTKHASFRKTKDLLARNQDNVSVNCFLISVLPLEIQLSRWEGLESNHVPVPSKDLAFHRQMLW